MSHISGNYSYDFVRLDPSWDNSLETGINSLVVGMTCSFSGSDSFDTSTTASQYVDGSTGFNPCISYEFLTGNLDAICNEFASGRNWFESLRQSVSGSIDHPVVVSNFPFPSSGEPHPHPPSGLN
jgi:hypothetical protein